MGFADYFCRHPTSKAIPLSQDDKNFISNLIDSSIFLQRKADKVSSNRNAEIQLEDNDVIHASERKQIKVHAISHSFHTNQLHSQKSNIVNVCTRNKPQRNTFDQKIIKKFRGPNRKDILSNEYSNTPSDNPRNNNNNTSTPPSKHYNWNPNS